jgi:hypothetical protein
VLVAGLTHQYPEFQFSSVKHEAFAHVIEQDAISSIVHCVQTDRPYNLNHTDIILLQATVNRQPSQPIAAHGIYSQHRTQSEKKAKQKQSRAKWSKAKQSKSKQTSCGCESWTLPTSKIQTIHEGEGQILNMHQSDQFRPMLCKTPL